MLTAIINPMFIAMIIISSIIGLIFGSVSAGLATFFYWEEKDYKLIARYARKAFLFGFLVGLILVHNNPI